MLKRLALLLTATTVLIGSPLAADLAHAQGRGNGRSEGRGDERRGDDRRSERSDDRRRGGGRDDGGRDDGGRRGYERRDDDREDGRGRRGPGGYLPPNSRGGVVTDPSRYRLRPAPRGYAWVRMGNGFALVSLSDGRIYDRVD